MRLSTEPEGYWQNMRTTKLLFLLFLSACTVKVDGPSQPPTPAETVQQNTPAPPVPPTPQKPNFPPDATVPPPAPADPNVVEAPVVSDVYCHGNVCEATLSWKPYKPYVDLTPPGFDGYVVLARISGPDTLNQPGFRYVQYDRFHTFSGPINIQAGVHNYFAILPYYKSPYSQAIFRNRSVEIEAVAP